MKGYLLDTSTCVFLLRGNRNVEEKLNEIDDFDLLIGSAAKAKGLVVVTHNRKHFEHIEGIQIEDWV